MLEIQIILFSLSVDLSVVSAHHGSITAVILSITELHRYRQNSCSVHNHQPTCHACLSGKTPAYLQKSLQAHGEGSPKKKYELFFISSHKNYVNIVHSQLFFWFIGTCNLLDMWMHTVLCCGCCHVEVCAVQAVSVHHFTAIPAEGKYYITPSAYVSKFSRADGVEPCYHAVPLYLKNTTVLYIEFNGTWKKNLKKLSFKHFWFNKWPEMSNKPGWCKRCSDI